MATASETAAPETPAPPARLGPLDRGVNLPGRHVDLDPAASGWTPRRGEGAVPGFKLTMPDGFVSKPRSSPRLVPNPRGTSMATASTTTLEATPTARDRPRVIAIADSRREEDQDERRPGAAVARVGTHAIVTVPDRRIEARTGPSGPAGSERGRLLGPDDEVPVVLDGIEVGRVAVRDVWP